MLEKVHKAAGGGFGFVAVFHSIPAAPEMHKFSGAYTTRKLSFYVFILACIKWLRRISILLLNRPEMLRNLEKGAPEMLVTGDVHH